MKDITLSYLDRKPVLAAGELEEKIKSAAPVLAAVTAVRSSTRTAWAGLAWTRLPDRSGWTSCWSRRPGAG